MSFRLLMPTKVLLAKMMKIMMIVLARFLTMKTKMILMKTTDVEDANAETETMIVIQMITTRIQKTIALMDSINSDMRIA